MNHKLYFQAYKPYTRYRLFLNIIITIISDTKYEKFTWVFGKADLIHKGFKQTKKLVLFIDA